MTKDKLITLLIEERKRDRLKQHCADLGLNVSQVLTKAIDDILNGSINPSAQTSTTILPIDIAIAIDAAIDKREPKLLDIIFNPTNEIHSKLQEHEDDIKKLIDSVHDLRITIGYLSDSVMKQGTLGVEIDPVSKQQSDNTLTPDQPQQFPLSDLTLLTSQSYTLEDTRTYLQGKGDYNRTREKRSDRISQDDISIHLHTYNYPHPSEKKWSRDEVRKVLKLWQIANS